MSGRRHRKPRLVVVVPLEGRARVYVVADTHEDELRLRRWLRGTAELRRAIRYINQLLDELEDAAA